MNPKSKKALFGSARIEPRGSLVIAPLQSCRLLGGMVDIC
jgi:hypothetical protein